MVTLIDIKRTYGDGAATGVHVEGCTYQNGAWHAVFNTNIGSVPIRINFIITYWG